ncbi:pyruvate/2-oxoglutarate dehydrogenase complex [uncultured Tateyamaria sp.]|uniref:pyruvate/2-oxoglutarate dehydrogenase complex n=1 Tax=uncultured Tateyamaria sp. TaxID=455651 RepID=UPI00261AFA70|nr:pyruvate/2-oxoglutarate dehydrogenase complex [uncultured Tateyamaria sp.]
MMNRYFCAAALAFPLFLTACDEAPVSYRSTAEDVTRLQSLGFSVAAQTPSGTPMALRYTGPINAAVQCRTPSGQARTPRPRATAANGTVEEYKLNSYVMFEPGSGARDGLYVVSKATRPSARRAATKVETIAFAPGERGTFASGLSCRAT